MGTKASIMLQENEIEEIQKQTGFSQNQIVRLYSRFTSLDKTNKGYLSREDLLRIPELAINPLGDRIVHAFFFFGNDIGINFKDFMCTLARFRPAKEGEQTGYNTREEKLRFAFKMYDMNGNGKLSRDELLDVLQMMVGANISEEQLGNIADRTIEEGDSDNDGYIVFEEFKVVLDKVDIEQKMSIRFLS